MRFQFVHALRSHLAGREEELARRWQAQVADERARDEHAELLRFETALSVEPGPGTVVLARARRLDGTPFWAGMPAERLLALHSWLTGSTGTGKTYLLLAALIQVLRTGHHPLLVLDMKGELSSLLTNVVVPALAGTQRGQAILENLRIIRPFHPRFVPELRITLPEPGVPVEIQAFNIASAIEEALESDLYARMTRVFLKLVSLAIECNEPLTVIQRWLEQPALFSRQACRSADPSIRQYANGAFLRENRSSIDAIESRMDTFLFLTQTRLALSTPGCISFADCLEGGLTIVDLGDPPAGAERAARFWAGVLVGRITRAILSRTVRDDTPQTWVILEEFQEVLAGRQIEQFARLLALARFKRVGLCFVNQQVAQIDPKLTRLLRTNTGMEAIFRCSLDDAKTLAHALPVSTDDSRASARRNVILQDMTRLPRRTYFAWFKEMAEPFGAQRVRSPRLDMDALKAAAARLPDHLRGRIDQGTVALARADVEARLTKVAAPAAPITTALLGPEPKIDAGGTPRLTPDDDSGSPFPSLG